MYLHIHTSQLFKFFKVHLLLSKNYLLICNSSSTSGQLSTYVIVILICLSHLYLKQACKQKIMPILGWRTLTLSRFLSAKLLHSNLIFVGLGSNHFEGNYHVLLRAENQRKSESHDPDDHIRLKGWSPRWFCTFLSTLNHIVSLKCFHKSFDSLRARSKLIYSGIQQVYFQQKVGLFCFFVASICFKRMQTIWDFRMVKFIYFCFEDQILFVHTFKAGMLDAGGQGGVPDFGRSEGAAGQRRRAALLLAPPDFQTLQHACTVQQKLRPFDNLSTGQL